MKLLKIFGFLFIACLFSHVPTASASSAISWQEKLQVQRAINQILSGHKRVNPKIGILVTSLDTGEVVYQKDAAHLMVPASVQKLLTAIAALVYLGPDFVFHTTLLTDSKSGIQSGILDGNLIIKFSGDPSLNASDVTHLFHELAAQGVHQIRGSVFVDNDDYNHVPYGTGWVEKDFMYRYAAPLNAIIINENSFNLTLRPSSQSNGRATVSSNLPPHAANFYSSLVTTSGKHSCPLAIQSDQQNNYRISGCISRKWGVQTSLLAVKSPDNYAKSLVALALHENHIRFSGSVRLHHDANATKILVTHQSAPLKTLIIRMLKKSDNMFANTLLKKLGQTYFNTTGTWENGAQAVKDILNQRAHVNFKTSVILDGAGLSPFNLISPNQLSALLAFAYHDRKVAPYLMQALPIAGIDGTLRNRMRSLSRQFEVRGKTGTMKSVSSLAGYLVTTKHHHLSFVIMVNGYPGRCYPYTRLQDQICQYLARNA